MTCLVVHAHVLTQGVHAGLTRKAAYHDDQWATQFVLTVFLALNHTPV
jgi:hypothetical protein